MVLYKSIYRDRNSSFIKDSRTGKWFGTSDNLFHEATHYATKTKIPFDVSNFWGDFYEVQKKGTGYVMGTLFEWQKLLPKVEGHLMPFILCKTKSDITEVGITRNTVFFTLPIKLRLSYPRGSILKNCKYLRDYELTEADTKELQAIYPGFCFTYLSISVRLPFICDIDVFGAEDMVLMEKLNMTKFHYQILK